MIHINKLSDCHQLDYDPELYREVVCFMLYCRFEFLKYEYEEDLDAFDFMVLEEEDLPMLNDLGTPEETVQINIKADGHIITIYRIIYPTEVLFIPAEISDKFSL